MKIIVVCGAGASSTFVATRLSRAATVAGLEIDASAIPVSALAADLAFADALLLGAHLGDAARAVRARAREHGVRVVDLPADIAADRDGARTLALVTDPGSATAGGPR
ncbi:hypothetical protein GCM10010915_14370 [Microbacterium faecale]|uniref:PTS EIIB type-3 domain-containing protein n=1 Tax=Microbacterium faecale TaxID=1804630 RepID=A0A916Y993_9MICO|nr:PTS sugar transporter [Microbacterium faecale]GGD35064.1 hypothetical protein GCM10010915_14370 [Microbacterium faecale]